MPVFVRNLAGLTDATNASVVDEHIKPAQLFNDLFHGRISSIRIADVSSKAAQTVIYIMFLDIFIDGLLVNINDGDFRSFG